MPDIKRYNLRVASHEIHAAQRVLALRAEVEDDLEDLYSPDIVVKRNVEISDALKVMEHRWPVVLSYADGTLFAIEVSREDHSKVAAILIDEIREQLPNMRSLLHGAGQDLQLNARIRQPDESLTPFPRHQQARYPSVVVEVAAAQGLDSVYRSATEYLDAMTDTDIQMVIMVKLWNRSVLANNTIKRRMLFLAFVRNPNPIMNGGILVPDMAISFGNLPLHTGGINYLVRHGFAQNNISGYLVGGGGHPACSHVGQAPYTVTLPSAPVFFRANYPIPPVVLNGLNVELFNVQEIALAFDK